MKICIVKDCKLKVHATGYCDIHYRRFLKHGDPLFIWQRPQRLLIVCKIDGCNKRINAREWCSAHYKKWQLHGDPLHGRTHERNGRRGTPAYWAWVGMKQRCSNPNHQKYKYYGGRGISVCERWVKSFNAFVEDMGERPKGLTIDRINPDGNYEPSNCRWATWSEQNLNKSKLKSSQVD